MVMATHAQALRKLWIGKCTVTVRQNSTNENTGRAVVNEVDIYTDEPCRISFQSITPTEPANNASRTSQLVKLFISPTVSIPPGSKITVTQNGVTGVYERSGVPAVYSDHQEIPLALFEEWA